MDKLEFNKGDILLTVFKIIFFILKHFVFIKMVRFHGLLQVPLWTFSSYFGRFYADNYFILNFLKVIHLLFVIFFLN